MFNLKHTLTEDQTVDEILNGRSVSRLGEGELRLIHGWKIKSQSKNPHLADELIKVVSEPSQALVCLPRLWLGMPNKNLWHQFQEMRYAKFYKLSKYGSAFITRSDVATNIDRPDYWKKIKQIWINHDVTLVSCRKTVLKLNEAKSIRFIECPPVDAYDEVDRIEEEIGNTTGPILICLGATATVLAVRLANKGLWALDLGHLGTFMHHAGMYSVNKDQLISREYIELNKKLHALKHYGGSGKKNADVVFAFANDIKARHILDYGCGQCTLGAALRTLGFSSKIIEYDPCIPGFDALPTPADLVVCTDVLEHVEPSKLDAVIAHIFSITKYSAFFVVATRPANKRLSDGRNAHLTIENADFWINKIENAGFIIDKKEVKLDHDVRLWCHK